MDKEVLVLGGLGYIGSHIVCELVHQNYKPIIVDNLSNCYISTLDKLKKITKQDLSFYQIDIGNSKELDQIFQKHNITGVIHLAAYKSVSDSIKHPLQYYQNNVSNTITLLEIMKKNNCYNLVFSSSATVYGNESSPVTENTQIGQGITNPYGKSKWICEEIIKDYSNSLSIENSIVILRYFNPIGNHKTGLIGDLPKGKPNNIMPILLEVIKEHRPVIQIYGNDYDTIDGTCLRDYIHVVDLARAHIHSLKYPGFGTFNIGTGKATSVFELIKALERASNKKIPYLISDRREGDVPIVFCDSKKANHEINWTPKLDINSMCKDCYRFSTQY